jgi:hypothetical protein
MNCREAENLYLSDETLALIGTGWDEASAKISAESGRFGNKAGKLSAAPHWDRQWEDLKDVINEVASILDPKNIHWTVRVGVALGRCAPVGQLREFLGTDIASALWKVP